MHGPSSSFTALSDGAAARTAVRSKEIVLRHAAANAPLCTRSVLDPALRVTVEQPHAAIVVSGGPSLHRTDTAARIKELDFRGIIIAVDGTLFYCLRHGIVPHYVVTVDPHETRIVRWFGDPDLATRLGQDDYYERQDYDPAFTQDALRRNEEVRQAVDRSGPQVRALIASCSAANVVDRCQQSGMQMFWWNPLMDDYDEGTSVTAELHRLNGLPALLTGGNVGTTAWVMAHSVLGASHVALTGMDLAYYPDTPLRNTQYFYELRDALGGDEGLAGRGYATIHNPDLGASFYTDPIYYWYRQTFLELATQAPCRTYNCTGGGILFGEGITTTDLQGFLQHARSGSA